MLTIAQSKLQKVVNDARYTITEEYNGKADPQYVLRFCDKFIFSGNDLNDVILDAIIHQDNRELKLLWDKE